MEFFLKAYNMEMVELDIGLNFIQKVVEKKLLANTCTFPLLKSENIVAKKLGNGNIIILMEN